MWRQLKKWDWPVVLILLCSLGFPGNYAQLAGDWLSTGIDYAAFALMLAVMLLRRGRSLLVIRRSNLPVYLFLCVLTVTSLIVTEHASAQIIACLRLCATAMFGLWLAERYTVRSVLKLFCMAQGVFLMLSLLFVCISPSLALQSTSMVAGAFRGLYTTKNTCANELSAGIVLTFLLWRDWPCRFRFINRYTPMLVLQILLLLWCQAIGSLIWTAVVLLCLAVFGGKRRMQPGWMSLGISGGFLAIVATILYKFTPILALLGKSDSLSGRTLLWSNILQLMRSTHTLTGFGYGMFWQERSAYGRLNQMFAEGSYMSQMRTGAHNMVLEMWLNIGLIGIFLFFLMLILCMRKYRRMEKQEYGLAFGFILLYSLHGLTERALDNHSYSTILLFICLGLGTQAIRRAEGPELTEGFHGN